MAATGYCATTCLTPQSKMWLSRGPV